MEAPPANVLCTTGCIFAPEPYRDTKLLASYTDALTVHTRLLIHPFPPPSTISLLFVYAQGVMTPMPVYLLTQTAKLQQPKTYMYRTNTATSTLYLARLPPP